MQFIRLECKNEYNLRTIAKWGPTPLKLLSKNRCHRYVESFDMSDGPKYIPHSLIKTFFFYLLYWICSACMKVKRHTLIIMFVSPTLLKNKNISTYAFRSLYLRISSKQRNVSSDRMIIRKTYGIQIRERIKQNNPLMRWFNLFEVTKS